jgi:hypothetical protein
MNTTKKLFFALAALASISVTHATGKKLSVNSFRQATVYTKDAATQTEVESPVTSSPSRLGAMLAFMKMQLQDKHRMLGFLAHQSKTAAYWAADVSYDIFKSTLRDVLKDKMKTIIKDNVSFLA